MFKVFRIKEEHSAFLSDGGGIGSRGFASVRSHHTSAFSPSFSLFYLFFTVLLYMFSLLYLPVSLSPCLCCYCGLTLYLQLTLSASLRFPLSPLPPFSSAAIPSILPHLIHPSFLPPHCHYPSSFIIYPLLYLPPSRPPSTWASISPLSLLFPMEAHKADGYSK